VTDAFKPIKWVLLDFNADVPANDSAQYDLVFTGGSGSTSTTSLNYSETSDALTVNTGQISFVINKQRFDFLSLVTKGSDTLVKAGTGEGGADILAVDSISGNTTYRTVFDKPESVYVEKEGPMRLVVKVTGSFRSTDLGGALNTDAGKGWINYTCRIYAYNNKDFIRVFFTIENNGYGGQLWAISDLPYQHLTLKTLRLNLVTTLSGSKNIATESYSGSYNSGESFYLKLGHNNISTSDESQNFYYTVEKAGSGVKNGVRTLGLTDLNDGSRGVLVGERHFWQNWPKGISVMGGTLGLDLFCDFNDSTNLFRAGRHKTCEMLLRFYSGSQSQSNSIERVKALESPLFAMAPNLYYTDTRCWGMIAPANLTHSDAEINEAMRRYEKFQRVKVDSVSESNYNPADTVKYCIPWNAEHRMLYYVGDNRNWFGWKNFGDLPWADLYCSLHYDWSYIMFLHYLRTGRRGFLDWGTAMVKHRYDIDQNHCKRVSNEYGENLNGIQFYEKGDHGVQDWNGAFWTPQPSHNWSEGVWLYYLLTGDLKARDCGEEEARAMVSKWTPRVVNNKTFMHELRHQGWSILNCLNKYRVTGDPAMLSLADSIFYNAMLFKEKELGNRGAWGNDVNPATIDTTQQFMLMMAYVMQPLINLHYETGDTAILNLLVRMGNFVRNHALMGGTDDSTGKYYPLGTSQYSDSVTAKSGATILNCFYAELYGYLYKMFGDSSDIGLARRLFRDFTFWTNHTGGDVSRSKSSRSPISWNNNGYPGTETKCNGWNGRAYQIYLFVEDSLQRPVKTEDAVGQAAQTASLGVSPNPFNPSTVIRYGIPGRSKVTVRVYGMNGKLMATLFSGVKTGGNHSVVWNGRDDNNRCLGSGLYLVKLDAGNKMLLKKVLMIK